MDITLKQILDVSVLNLPALISGVFLAITISIVFYYGNLYQYWSSRKIPGPKPLPIVGNALSYMNKSFPEIQKEWTNKFGPNVGIYEGTKKILLVSEAHIINDICIKNFTKFTDRRAVSGHSLIKLQLINKNSQEWKVDRSLMSPTFTSGKMKSMYPLMKECYEPLECELERLAKSRDVVDARKLFGKLTSTVIARCAFATKVDPYTDPNNPIVHALSNFFNFGKVRPLFNLILPAWIKNVMSFTVSPPDSFYLLVKVCQAIVEERKIQGKKNKNSSFPDFLQLLMETWKGMDKEITTTDVVDNEAHHTLEDQVDIKKELTKSTKQFTDDEIVANTLLFFIAGFETTSNLLTSASLVLATNSEIQEKLYQEVKKAFDDSNIQTNALSYEKLTSIKYLDAFLSEVLRLHTPVTRIERTCVQDHILPNGIKVEKGTIIHVPIYLIHHKSEYFDDVETFNPDRFMPENRHKVIAGSYLPFVIGPRNCIGMRFALMEAKLALVNLIINYKILPNENMPEKFTFVPSTPLLARKEGVFIKFSPRLP